MRNILRKCVSLIRSSRTDHLMRFLILLLSACSLFSLDIINCVFCSQYCLKIIMNMTGKINLGPNERDIIVIDNTHYYDYNEKRADENIQYISLV